MFVVDLPTFDDPIIPQSSQNQVKIIRCNIVLIEFSCHRVFICTHDLSPDVFLTSDTLTSIGTLY